MCIQYEFSDQSSAVVSSRSGHSTSLSCLPSKQKMPYFNSSTEWAGVEGAWAFEVGRLSFSPIQFILSFSKYLLSMYYGLCLSLGMGRN